LTYVPRSRTYFPKTSIKDLLTPWAKGCFFEPVTSHVRNNTFRNTDAFGRESEVIWFHESEPKYTPVPGRGYAPAKIFVCKNTMKQAG